MDKCTVVSIYPKRIDEVKHTIQPGRFIIEPGTYKNPSLLIVGPSSWWRDIDEEQPLLEIPNSSIQVADSIVNDYCNGLLGCNMSSAMPGLFYIMGEWDIIKLKKDHQGLIDKANTQQNNWFSELVKMADALWARSSGNPLTISEDMRLAARELSLVDKDWMKDFTMTNQVRCIACGSLKNPLYPVCPTCRAVDKDKAKELNLVFAQ
jgi:hypothetical protein